MKRFAFTLKVLARATAAVLAGMFGEAVSCAQLVVPGANGSDGVFSPTENIVIDLSKATEGKWDTDNFGNQGNGVYDGEKWAVVFKYSSVNIPAGVTVSFSPNASRAPVVWLISGDVQINGKIVVRNAGAFRGGRTRNVRLTESAGYGWGGGQLDAGQALYAKAYGNSSIIPLIGGSGGAGRSDNGGGQFYATAGGGAILIACGGSMLINGSIDADADHANAGGNGSGGAIRLVASALSGAGSLTAIGGPRFRFGGDGRIRLEALSVTGTLVSEPETSFFTPRNPVQLWPEDTAPFTRIVSVGGAPVGNDPKALLGLPGADVNLEVNAPVPIIIETKNLPINSSVSARITPWEGPYVWVPAAFTSGTAEQALWTATYNLPKGFNAIQVRAVAP